MLKKLDAFNLKIIGIICMVFDHIHQMWAMDGAPTWFNMVGRIVAPIFIFLAAEGIFYTRNRLAYLRNLLVGYWLMSFIDFFLPKVLPNDHVALMNNIFGTLLLATLFMIAYDLIKRGLNGSAIKGIVIGLAIILAIILYSVLTLMLFSNPNMINISIILFTIFPSLMLVEGGVLFVLLGLLFFIFRNNRLLQIISLAAIAFISLGNNFTGLFTTNIQWMMIFAGIFIWLYSGKEGKKLKWFFYVFYPMHLVLLYIISTLVS